MEVALQELDTAAKKLDPNYARIYNIYGLVYAMLGQSAPRPSRVSRGR